MEGIGAVGLIWREMAELSAGDGAIIRSGNTVTIFIIIIVVIIVITIIMMVTAQHIPTMTKSHHGGEMSVMIKVGKCQ